MPPFNGPLARYVKLPIAHVPGMLGTVFPTTHFKINHYLAIPAFIWHKQADILDTSINVFQGID